MWSTPRPSRLLGSGLTESWKASLSTAHDVHWPRTRSDHPSESTVQLEDRRNPYRRKTGDTCSGTWLSPCRASSSLVPALGLTRLRNPAQKCFGDFGGFVYGVDQHCLTVLGCNLRRGQLQQGEHLTKQCKYWSSVSEMGTGGTVPA